MSVYVFYDFMLPLWHYMIIIIIIIIIIRRRTTIGSKRNDAVSASTIVWFAIHCYKMGSMVNTSIED